MNETMAKKFMAIWGNRLSDNVCTLEADQYSKVTPRKEGRTEVAQGSCWEKVTHGF